MHSQLVFYSTSIYGERTILLKFQQIIQFIIRSTGQGHKLFSNNIYWLTTFGACHSLLFMYLIDENSITNAKADYSKKHRKKFSEASRDRIMNYYTRKDWLKSPIFYIVVSFLHKNNISKYITIYILS